MSRNNGRPDILKKSTPDMVAMSQEVQQRFATLRGAYRRIKGMDLVPPAALDRAMLLWRTMAVRHKRGDFRNSDSEKKAVRAIAEWMVRTNCELRNQAYQPIQWKD